MAKKFKFRLETVLQIRTQEAENAQNRLVEILRLRTAKEEEIAEKKRYHAELLASSLHGKISAGSVEARWFHARTVEREIRDLEKERDQLLEIENLRRLELAEAMKQQKTVEKLKEKKREAHTREQLKEEQNFLDEIAQRGKFSDRADS